jgi:DNA-damage-inducible protein J
MFYFCGIVGLKEVMIMPALIKDTNFNMRINHEKKADLEALYSRLGMTLPEAVNIFFENSLLVGGIPFDVRLPRYNRETEDAINEACNIMSGKIEAKSYGSARELFSELDDE